MSTRRLLAKEWALCISCDKIRPVPERRYSRRLYRILQQGAITPRPELTLVLDDHPPNVSVDWFDALRRFDELR